MTQENTTNPIDSELEQAKLFAKDFNIPYDKIKIGKVVITYKRDADREWDGTTGNPGYSVPIGIVMKYKTVISAHDKERTEAYKKGYIDGGINQLTNPNGDKR